MDTFALECIIVPVDFSMVGVTQINLPIVDQQTLELKETLNIVPDDTKIDLLCVRWSNRPDLIAATPRVFSDNSNVSEANERATAQLRRLYEIRGVPWPE